MHRATVILLSLLMGLGATTTASAAFFAVDDNTGDLYSADSDGSGTLKYEFGGAPEGMTRDGNTLYISDSPDWGGKPTTKIYAYDFIRGDSEIYNFTGLKNVDALAMVNGQLIGSNNKSLVQFDLQNRTYSVYNVTDADGKSFAAGGKIEGLTVGNGSLFAASKDKKINKFTDGELVGTFDVDKAFEALMYADGSLFGAVGAGVYKIDLENGDSTLEWSTRNMTDIEGLAAVPLPAAAWLFGSALLGMIGLGARRKMKA